MQLGRILLFVALFICASTTAQRVSWAINPFQQKVFIENNGQLTQKINGESILFYTKISGLDIYFTASGPQYYHTLYKTEERKSRAKEHEEREKEIKAKTFSFHTQFKNHLPDVKIETSGEKSFYYTYSEKNNDACVVAKAYEKIIYKNVYPHIDIEYLLPEKGGIKYNILLHPGANIADVQFYYPDAKSITFDAENNLIIQSKLGQFIDHAPISFYENGEPIISSFLLNKRSVSFNVTKKTEIPNSKSEIIIDPWIITPVFTNFDAAYDVDHDHAGNVYVYGDFPAFALAKINAAGALQWVFTTTNFGSFSFGGNSYGDMAVDKNKGNTFLVEGGDDLAPPEVWKINTAGIKTASIKTMGNLELWRAEYSECLNKVLIGIGAYAAPVYSHALVDTGLTSISYKNTLNITSFGIDVSSMALDPYSGDAYSLFPYGYPYSGTQPYNNALVKYPLPSMGPYAFSTKTTHTFNELLSISFPGNLVNYSNGYNGITVNRNAVYSYDGAKLFSYNKNTGSTIKNVSTGGTLFKCGGVTADDCDNIYAGADKVIKMYDANLNQQNSFTAPNTVYDVDWGKNGNKLYACGIGFVASIDLTGPTFQLSLNTTPVDAQGCQNCNGTATVDATVNCGSLPALQYLWAPGGQTTQTATGLCPGTYTVTVTSYCNSTATATTLVKGSTGGASITTQMQSTDADCGKKGNASVAASGGGGNYTYLWQPGGFTSSTVSGLNPGNYSVTVSDKNGCTTLDSVKINSSTGITVSYSFTTNPSCGKNCLTFTAQTSAALDSYTWLFGDGNSSTLSSPEHCYTTAGIFTIALSVKDQNGCTALFSDTAHVLFPATADAQFIVDPMTTTDPSTVFHFQNQSTNADAYLWSFAGLATSTEQNPSISFDNEGIYCVQLKAINTQSQCNDSVEVCVEIQGDFSFYVPNSFTPNNDGKNDVWLPKGYGIEESTYEVIVYDRWGNLIWENTSWGKAWDGKVLNGNNELVQIDTYVYRIVFQDTFKKEFHSYVGSVNIIR